MNSTESNERLLGTGKSILASIWDMKLGFDWFYNFSKSIAIIVNFTTGAVWQIFISGKVPRCTKCHRDICGIYSGGPFLLLKNVENCTKKGPCKKRAFSAKNESLTNFTYKL